MCAATSGYQAGTETNDTEISYAIETTWGTAPAVAFQAIRYTSESMTQNRTRQRPSEITATREASQGVTTQNTASGTINFALQNSTHDEFFAMTLQNEWQAAQAINGASGDITMTVSGGVVTLTSTTTAKFANISALQWIRILGFTATADNGWWFVSVKGSNASLTLTGPNSGTASTETPATTAAKVRASTIKNSTVFRSMFIQKKLSSTLYLTYPGAYPTQMTVTGALGAYGTGTINLSAKSETKATTNGSTGAVTAAPTGRVIDPVAGFVGIFWNEAAIGAGIDRFTLTLDNAGGASEFAMGSTAAQGILGGTFTASATFRAYFKDFTEYNLYAAETQGRLAFIVKDPAGASYAFTLLAAVLSESRIVAGGPGQPVYAEFTAEGGPSGSGTLVIDRMAAS